MHYLFDENWILAQKFNWELNITVSANRLFDTFALINAPPDTDWLASANTYYINGPKFEKEDGENDIPYFLKMPNDCKITHGRNAFIKTEVYYDQYRGGETKTFCLRMDHSEVEKRVKPMNIMISNNLSVHDSWILVAKKKYQYKGLIDICQSISVQKGDQYALL
jgi:hypothetical protein